VHALEQSDRRLADLERFSEQQNIETGSRARAIGAGLVGVTWTIAPLFAPSGPHAASGVGRWQAIALYFSAIVALGIWARLARRELAASSVTRRLMRGALIAMLCQLALNVSSWLLDLDRTVTEVLSPLILFCVSAMLTATVDRRLAPTTLGFLGALFVGVFWPELRFYGMAASNLVMTINMFWIWMPGRKPASFNNAR